jgi:hypothetical protein
LLSSYTRYRRYAQFQSENPDTVLNGTDLDVDYDRIKVVCDALVAGLADVRRDDGGVKNTSVGVDQLKTEVLTLLDGVTPRGAWVTSTSYAVCDLVRQANVLYFALVAHTSGVFATDLAADKWMAISAATNASSVGNVPAGSISATDVQAALNELDTEKQPIDATLTAIAAVTVAANKLVYATGVDAFATTDFTATARTLLAGADAAAMRGTLGAVSKGGDTMTGALELSGAPTSSLHAATKEYVDNTASARSAPVRQTIMGGPVSSSTGLPNLLPATGATLNFTSQNVSASSPVVVAAANGFGVTGALDLVGYSSANLTWTGLTASRAAATPNFLYVLVNADATLTTGKTLLAPIYQWGGVPSTTNGQFTFNIGEMKGYLGNGSTAAQAYVVFVGEAATDGTGVISTVTYAYNGRYASAFTNTVPAASAYTSANHNIGVKPSRAKLIIENISAELGYAVGDQISEGHSGIYSTVYVPIPIVATDKTIGFQLPVTTSFTLFTRTGGIPTQITRASWKYGFVADRGW